MSAFGLEGGLDFRQPSVNRVNLTFSDLRSGLAGPNYPRRAGVPEGPKPTVDSPPSHVTETPRELDAAHFVIGPVLEIADCQHLQERIGADKFVAGGPTSDVSGGHKGGSVGLFCTG
jgi:hypothetical protein